MKRAMRRHSAGLTLVELMVAMAVGLIITLAAASALVAARHGFATVDAASQLRDNARFATEFIRRLAVQAGYRDLPYAATKRVSAVGLSAAALPHVFGFDHAVADRTSLNAGKTRPVGTFGDVLVLRYQATEPFPGATEADEAMIDCAGFSTKALPTNRDDLRTSVLFVDGSNDGEPALKCYRSNNGQPDFDAAEVLVRGVENFQVLYGVDGVKPKAVIDPKDLTTKPDSVPERYLRADQLTVDTDPAATQANWRRVRSLRIGLILRSDPGAAVETISRTLHPLGSEAFASAADEGTIFTTPSDNRLRQVVTFTVHLRNDQGL